MKNNNMKEISKEKLDRVQSALRALLVQVETKAQFRAGVFCKENKLEPDFVKICIELALITKSGSDNHPTYKRILRPSDVEPRHARLIIKALSEFRSKKYKELKISRSISYNKKHRKSEKQEKADVRFEQIKESIDKESSIHNSNSIIRKSRPGGVRKSTISKYMKALRDLLREIALGKEIDSTLFCNQRTISVGFVNAAIELGYIETAKYKNTYKSKLDNDLVEAFHAEQIARLLAAKNRSSKPLKKSQPIKTWIEPEESGCLQVAKDGGGYIEVGLQGYSTQDILNELKRRGYRGKVERVEELNF